MSFLINPFAFAVAGGDFESIATVTVGSGGASSIEFTSIPSTFAHLQVRILCRSDRSGQNLDFPTVQVNADTGSNYARHTLYGNGSTAQAAAVSSTSAMVLGTMAGGSATANAFGASIFDIFDYSDTSKYKTLRSVGSFDNNGSGEVRLYSGLWMSTSAITSIKIYGFYNDNMVQHSTAALYGVKAP
jgi:hypothetical protein